MSGNNPGSTPRIKTEKSRRNIWDELLVGLAAMAGAVVLGSMAMDFPSGGEQFPLFISGCMIVVGILVLTAPARQPERYGRQGAPGQSWDTWKPVAVLGVTVLYVVAVFQLGYYVSTFVFLVLAPLLAGIRKPLIVLGNSAACTLFIYVLFQVLLHTQLPSGTLF